MNEERKNELLQSTIDNLKLIIEIAYQEGKIAGIKEALTPTL